MTEQFFKKIRALWAKYSEYGIYNYIMSGTVFVVL